jgi:hypothetical protein
VATRTSARTVTLVSTGDLAWIYDVPPITVRHWRPWDRPEPGSGRGRGRPPATPQVYDPEAAERSILGPRLAHISGRDVYDLDTVVVRIAERTRTKPDPIQARLAEVRERATVPAGAVVAGYAEVAELLGKDPRHIPTLDTRGKLPPPIALVGPEGRRSRIKVFAVEQFRNDPDYDQARADELARRHREGP